MLQEHSLLICSCFKIVYIWHFAVESEGSSRVRVRGGVIVHGDSNPSPSHESCKSVLVRAERMPSPSDMY